MLVRYNLIVVFSIVFLFTGCVMLIYEMMDSSCKWSLVYMCIYIFEVFLSISLTKLFAGKYVYAINRGATL